MPLKPTRNNSNSIEFKKELEILEETTKGQYNNDYICWEKHLINLMDKKTHNKGVAARKRRNENRKHLIIKRIIAK